jgi:hypothetical protein
VYLNLPLHPGSKRDANSPRPPARGAKRAAENLGYPGVELDWTPARDDNWISCYEVFRDGSFLDKVAKGTYYFDHSAGADPGARYEILAVDGAGNRSPKVLAKGPPAETATVFDDGSDGAFRFAGDWRHEHNCFPAHEHTLTSSAQRGASIELQFNGCRVLVFAKLGPECGKLMASIDGGAGEAVDTYSADDIWGACVFQKRLPAPGAHSLRIEVLGQGSSRAKDSLVRLDGVRVEPNP